MIFFRVRYERAGFFAAALQDYGRIKGEDAESSRLRLVAKLNPQQKILSSGSGREDSCNQDSSEHKATNDEPQTSTKPPAVKDNGKPFSNASLKALRDITRTFLLEPPP